MTSRTTTILQILTFLAALLAVSGSALAQATPTAAGAATTEGTTTRDDFDSRTIREELNALLDRHPHEVGVMLKLDPSLFQNEAWIASYPAIRDFVRKHPEVPMSPSYYLDRVHVPGDVAPEPAAVRTANQLMESITIFMVFLTVVGSLSWLIRTLLEHRRWSRVSRAQTEIYNKLLDRFTSHEDLLRYVQSTAGKDFIQSAISPISTGTSPSIAAPVGRILWSAQVGIILIALGFGMQFVSGRLHADVAGSISTLGVLALCAGLGSAVSSVVAWVVSRKLGILPPLANESSTETELTSPRTLGEQ